MRLTITAIAFFIFGSAFGQAQNLQKHQLQTQLGLSWVGVFAKLANEVNVVEDIRISTTPVFHFNYDYFMYEKVSLGAGFGYQRISAFYDDYQYESDGETVTEDFSSTLTRLNFSARALYWYTKTKKLSLYSGLRLGVSNWSADTEVGDPNFDPDRYINLALGANFAPQLILIGGDFPLAEHLRIGGELAIGAPYFVSGGFTYRW
ncbi:hypothetical protein PZB74_02175 [Porifericola rhodea]|uniref:hypothetical protein n=1 Tax=Porifericola rhodea TaxID=930972 RepID=UPI002664F6C7|nr:hypothetical protein [Porifericola rhodea]WKN32160.1 hypothetical protein PZB74_02175 [Porifericola rhodea]